MSPGKAAIFSSIFHPIAAAEILGLMLLVYAQVIGAFFGLVKQMAPASPAVLAGAAGLSAIGLLLLIGAYAGYLIFGNFSWMRQIARFVNDRQPARNLSSILPAFVLLVPAIALGLAPALATGGLSSPLQLTQITLYLWVAPATAFAVLVHLAKAVRAVTQNPSSTDLRWKAYCRGGLQPPAGACNAPLRPYANLCKPVLARYGDRLKQE